MLSLSTRNIKNSLNHPEQTRPVCSDAKSYFGWVAGGIS
jgi:hypothetical protein